MINMILKIIEKIGTLFFLSVATMIVGIIPITLSCFCLVGILSWFTNEDYTQVCFAISFIGFILYGILQDKLNKRKEKHHDKINEQEKIEKDIYTNNKNFINNEHKRYQEQQQQEVEEFLNCRDRFKQTNLNTSHIISDGPATNPQAKYTKKDIENINHGRLFEEFVYGCFKEHGYQTILTPLTNDGGKDIIVEKNGVKTYIECKYWHSGHSIGREAIQKLAGAAMMDGVKNAIFITTSSYHSNAYDAARALNSNGFNIQLWDTDKLLKFINS